VLNAESRGTEPLENYLLVHSNLLMALLTLRVDSISYR
jgi:hypothetical protein